MDYIIRENEFAFVRVTIKLSRGWTQEAPLEERENREMKKIEKGEDEDKREGGE